MALTDRHPEFVARIGEWMQMHDTYEGERTVKSKRLDYLPATEGMIQDGMTTPTSPGWKDYDAYLMRAVYHDAVKDAVKAMVGIMHMKPAEIQLPRKLEPMMGKATIDGEGLQMLLRRVNEAQLKYGRCGLLVDAPTGADVDKTMPYIAFYNPQNIVNWDSTKIDEGRNQLDLVVLDESGFQRVGYSWKQLIKHRVLVRGLPEVLIDGEAQPGASDLYNVAVKVQDVNIPVPEDFFVPSIGGRPLNDIPFVFIGANDLLPDTEVPPLLGLSNLALAIYRGEADYRQTLFLQGQQTLVIIGGNVDETDGQLRTGAKGLVDLKIGGDAKYIGVSAQGLSEMRASIAADALKAAQFGVAFLDVGNARGESGEALRVRVAARTTTVSSVAQAAGAGLERALKFCAQWVGADPDEVIVKPQTDFADQSVAGAALLAFMQAKQLGLPLSLKSLHRMMQLNDMTEMSFDVENLQIESEAESLIGQLVSPPQIVTDEGFLDTPAQNEVKGAGAVPVTPHVRGQPDPLKRKVGKKGDSAKTGVA